MGVWMVLKMDVMITLHFYSDGPCALCRAIYANWTNIKIISFFLAADTWRYMQLWKLHELSFIYTHNFDVMITKQNKKERHLFPYCDEWVSKCPKKKVTENWFERFLTRDNVQFQYNSLLLFNREYSLVIN